MPLTALQAVRDSGILIASDTGEYNKIGEFYPQDATTNPSLVLAAVKKPEYAHLIDRAVEYVLTRRDSIEARTQLALDHLLVQVGIQILNIIPGRVSVSIDPRLANDRDAIVNKGHDLIAIFEELGISRERVLIKIPGTYSGILAARILETPVRLSDGTMTDPIHTNATLIFGRVQALACAQAGMAVISPFIGRVKDWWAAREPKSDGATNPEQPLSEHPGIILVQQIRSAYASYGHRTGIMAAGFRRVEEIVELGKRGSRGGPDIVTLPPDLLAGLRDSVGVVSQNEFTPDRERQLEPVYIPPEGPTLEGEARYTKDVEEEMIALDKVPEGLAKFTVDAKILEDLIRGKVESGSVETSAGMFWFLGWPRWLGRLF
ncbi:hypothetical protein BDZ94DRAFT_1324746 [Collybia nuda]|uniref:Transaldolase n=1 Tax=Collybia nuda TaxID=64659 RepID=A0A9P6CBG5_9AGAR|nr:hypothetical protein BDZ94DRAFT_1324746 [Collybia nuda]